MNENNLKQFRIYRSKKDNTGSCSSWQLSYKPDNKYDKWLVFLIMTKQTGMDDNGNAVFDWSKEVAITVKLGEADLGEILGVLDNRKESVGSRGSLFHETPNNLGNKSIAFQHNESGFYLKVSHQNAEKQMVASYSQVISEGEGAILSTLLKAAVVKMYNW